MSRRTERVADLLREELALLVQHDLKDPLVAHGLVTITEVVVSADLGHAVVYVSHLGEEGDRPGILEGLTRSARWMQEELGRQLRMWRVPTLQFRLDTSLEHGARISALINELSSEETPKAGA